jgi:hypothetical protein
MAGVETCRGKGERMAVNFNKKGRLSDEAVQFVPDVIRKLARRPGNDTLTDEIFLTIENNSYLMRGYDMLVNTYSKNSVNCAIGKAVKRIYGLTNANDRGIP